MMLPLANTNNRALFYISSVDKKPSERQVSARQPCVYEDLFLPSQRCLTPPS